MKIPWRMPKALEDRVIESLLDPSFITDETIEALLKHQPHALSYAFLSSEGYGGAVDVTFDLLLEAGNQRAIKAYIKAGDHYNLALVCSAPLRKQAQRAMTLRKFGDSPKDSEFWQECLEYFFVFTSDEIVNKHDEDDEWVLTSSAQAVSDYVHGQFRIYDNACDFVFQATTRDREQLYHGHDRLEMYEAIYKELIK